MRQDPCLVHGIGYVVLAAMTVFVDTDGAAELGAIFLSSLPRHHNDFIFCCFA